MNKEEVQSFCEMQVLHNILSDQLVDRLLKRADLLEREVAWLKRENETLEQRVLVLETQGRDETN